MTLNSITSVCLLFLIVWGGAGSQYPASKQQEDQEHQERLVEKVDVTNIEVPVRVLYKGKPVTGLTKDDFTLYENKKKVLINGFFNKRKKIDVKQKRDILVEGSVKPAQPRSFVLVFSITDFNSHIQKAVDHLFSHVLRPNDRLMIFANNRTITHPQIRDGQTIKKQLIDHLRNESKEARRRLLNYIYKVETFLRVHDFRVEFSRRNQRPQKILDFLKKYQLTWNDYKSKYLTPRMDRFYYFSRFLENVKGEKWVLNFYQFDLFPRIRLGSETMDWIRDYAVRLINHGSPSLHAIGKLIFTLMNQMLIDFNVSKGVPVEEISKLFYKVDATFHSFFIRSLNKAGFNDLEYDEVASDIERTLKEITRITGGKNITSNNLVQSIETVTQLEDQYYLLTYAPADPEKAGKIKIKVNNRKYDVLYDDNLRADYIADYFEKLAGQIKTPDVRITNFSFKKKVLVFTVSNYIFKDEGSKNVKGSVGRLQVRIRLKDKNGNPIFDQSKTLTAQQKVFKISLGAFKGVREGEYDFIIDVIDLFSGKKANYHQNVVVK